MASDKPIETPSSAPVVLITAHPASAFSAVASTSSKTNNQTANKQEQDDRIEMITNITSPPNIDAPLQRVAVKRTFSDAAQDQQVEPAPPGKRRKANYSRTLEWFYDMICADTWASWVGTQGHFVINDAAKFLESTIAEISVFISLILFGHNRLQ